MIPRQRSVRLPHPRSAAVLLSILLLSGMIAVSASGPAASAAAGPPSVAADSFAAVVLPPGDTPPPTALSRLRDAGTAKEHPDVDNLVAYQQTVNRLRARGVAWTEGYTLYKVLTAAGAAELGVLRFDYEPLSSRVEVRAVTVLRDSVRIPVPLDSVLDLPQPQEMIYWGSRMKVLQLPRLEVNDGIEVVTFRKGFSYALLAGGGAPAAGAGTGTGAGTGAGAGAEASAVALTGAAGAAGAGTTLPDTTGDSRFVPPMEGEYFDIVRFQAMVPILEMEYRLVLPAGKRLQSEVYNGPLYAATRYTADSTIYSWRGRDLPALPSEVRQPDDTDICPKVVLATVESWEAKSRWFLDVNRGQFEVTEAIREKVREILEAKGATNAPEARKAELLLHWVAQNIRYSGQTMGEGEGYTLHSGEMIFQQRSGVCKDIAGMLVTMMRAAGMDSHAAMTMAGSRIEEIPADQFNHCVVALPGSDGRYVMYDPTWAPFDRPVWSKSEAEQHYLIGSARGETRSRIAYSPPGESPLHATDDVTLLPDGTLEGTLSLEGKGAVDGRLRGFVSGTRTRDLEKACAGMLAVVSDAVEIRGCEHGVPDDFDRDMWLRIRYRIPQYALPVGEGMEFLSPLLKLVKGHYLFFRGASVTWEKERKTDILLYFTQRLDGTETVRLPAGYALHEPPKKEKADETYAMFDARVVGGRGIMTVTTEGELRRRQIPPAGFAGFAKVMERIGEWSEQSFRVEKGGAR
jgi:hypothetical protein